MIKEIQNIVIIGSGNVAYHIINSFRGKGIHILQILARNEITARELSATFNIPYILESGQLKKEADLYILAVQDDHIHEAADSLNLNDQFLVHTSGFTPIDVLRDASLNTGVIWPLQTLTSGKASDYQHIPFFIEGNTDENAKKLARFAGLVSDHIRTADSPTRAQIHLAAVIASNLTNHLYSISASLLEKHDIPFDVLVPLILETAEKAGRQHPSLNQTGPAARKDLHVIEKHLELLKDDPAYREIYRMITENIMHHHLDKNEKL